MELKGNIISGEFDQLESEFILQSVKHFSTKAVINENQLNALYDYLNKHKDDTYGHVLTLYDQMPVRLNQEEVSQFLNDLESVRLLSKGK
ncbi:hypothetical protein ACFQ3N_17235 [Virgibacillus byunsanensis]|uniref:Uncharacterized protein n=1 Tax=Virgibacillus byunsanensis TaxID=570945 RepID=A0ABW3LSX1_9BACI